MTVVVWCGWAPRSTPSRHHPRKRPGPGLGVTVVHGGIVSESDPGFRAKPSLNLRKCPRPAKALSHQTWG
eukprot:5451627-Prymnesium_polylepis.1